MSVFLDTSFLLAYYFSKDKNHERARQLMEDIVKGEFGAIFVSDYVFDELLTLARARIKNQKKAIELGETILGSEANLVFLTPEVFKYSRELFNKRKNLSFTDCSTIALMKSLGIKNLATFDKEFKQFSKEINVLV